MLAAVCHAYGNGVSMHLNTHLGISLAAMTHAAAPRQAEDVITTQFSSTDGWIAVSDAPGLGIDLDRDALARPHRRWQAMPALRDRVDIAAIAGRRPRISAADFPEVLNST